MLDDTKGVIRRRKSKDQEMQLLKEKAQKVYEWSSRHYKENKRLNNMSGMNTEGTRVFQEC
jgi:hypothetical protein